MPSPSCTTEKPGRLPPSRLKIKAGCHPLTTNPLEKGSDMSVSVLPTPAPSQGTAEVELQAFAAEHGISLLTDYAPDAEAGLDFGRDEDGGFLMRATPDVPPAEILAFAREVIARHKTDSKLMTALAALRAVDSSNPGFSDLVNALQRSAAWHMNAAGEFIEVIHAALDCEN